MLIGRGGDKTATGNEAERHEIMTTSLQFGDGMANAPSQVSQQAGQQVGAQPHAPRSPHQAEAPRLDPAQRKPRQITDWASI